MTLETWMAWVAIICFIVLGLIIMLITRKDPDPESPYPMRHVRRRGRRYNWGARLGTIRMILSSDYVSTTWMSEPYDLSRIERTVVTFEKRIQL